MTKKIIAITTNNDFVHVYKTVARALRDPTVSAATGPAMALEFFDSQGYRLDPVYTQGRITGLQRTTESLDLALLRTRIGTAKDYLLSYISTRSAMLAMFGLDVREATELIERAYRRASAGGGLPLEAFEAHDKKFRFTGIYGEGHDRSFWHNWWDH
ncbi:MAG: hypothetical protein ACRCYU_13555 [Nocardioides sp.]